MTQGLNLRADFWRMSESSDDSVGGASITGTVVYAGQPCYIHARRPSQQSLEQGLEVEAIYDMTVGARLTIYERDETQVTGPSDHPYYGLRFRIMGVQPPKHHRTGAQHLTLSRIRQSRSQQ